jgi:hypothetical protein
LTALAERPRIATHLSWLSPTSWRTSSSVLGSMSSRTPLGSAKQALLKSVPVAMTRALIAELSELGRSLSR